jgi:hypothetical protein
MGPGGYDVAVEVLKKHDLNVEQAAPTFISRLGKKENLRSCRALAETRISGGPRA